MGNPTERRFNLVDEAWIPVSGEGRVSLMRIFTDPGLKALGGNPVEKIAIMKLLLAITQAAHTPENDEEWAALGSNGIAAKSVHYLEEKRDLFWLYGDKPFLQIPAISSIPERNYGTGFYPDLQADNNPILFQCQIDNGLDDNQRAMFLITLMGFALGGKRIGEPVVLSNGYIGKTKSAKAGPNLGYKGYLHNFLSGITIHDTIWLNLYTSGHIKRLTIFPSGLGTPPWEKIPEGEDCETAKKLKRSYMGCLIPLCRFVFFGKDTLNYTEGIQYPNHKSGWREPSIAYNDRKKNLQMLWADPQKRPWREVVSLLSFVTTTQMTDGFECRQIQDLLSRPRKFGVVKFGIWSGGLSVTDVSSDQSVKKDDDYIESEVYFYSEWFGKDNWLTYLKNEMNNLNEMAKIVTASTIKYFDSKNKNNKKISPLAKNKKIFAESLFWQLSERQFQKLVDACGEDSTGEKAVAMRRIFIDYANRAFNSVCPRDTARQMEAWAANRPSLGRFLKTDIKQ